jgi:hypothetical protein
MRHRQRYAVEASGGCQCGAVRFRVTAMMDNAHICHCRMCQKAVGSPFAALAAAPRDALEWTRGHPARFASSDQVTRGFCRDCGTPLYYDYIDGGQINLLIATFDDPDLFPPHQQFGIESRRAWFGALPALPDTGPTEATMASVAPSIAASNRQHPDHDTTDWPQGEGI